MKHALYMLDDKLKVKNINIMALLASKQYENHVERYYKIKKDNKYQQEENIISNEEVKMKLNEMISSKEIKNQEQRNKKDELIKHKNNDENIRINKKGESIIKKEDIGFKKYKKML